MLSIRESTIALKNLLVEGENKERTDVDKLTSNTMVRVCSVVVCYLTLIYLIQFYLFSFFLS
jgi:hypothetical protein